jgi:hypothetical protein
MSNPELQLGLMKLLSTKHFPLAHPRPKIKVEKLIAVLGRIKIQAGQDDLFVNLNELKGRGLVNTTPKIIMKDEIDTAEFEIWLTPLGRTELVRLMEEEQAG